MLNVIATDLQLYNILNIMQVSFFLNTVYIILTGDLICKKLMHFCAEQSVWDIVMTSDVSLICCIRLIGNCSRFWVVIVCISYYSLLMFHRLSCVVSVSGEPGVCRGQIVAYFLILSKRFNSSKLRRFVADWSMQVGKQDCHVVYYSLNTDTDF